MDIEIKVPPVGESITEVTLSRWAKEDGAMVKMDEIIAELESDKATFELTAEKAGVLHHKVTEGETIAVGTLVAIISSDASVNSEKTSAQQDLVLAEMNKSNDEGKNITDTKSAANLNANPIVESKTGEDSYANGYPSPASAKVLAEKGVDPKLVTGTGRDGRIMLSDALKANADINHNLQNNQNSISNSNSAQKSTQVSSISSKEDSVKGSFSGNSFQRGERKEKLSNLRKTIGKRLVAVKNETAMLTTFNEVDMQPIMELRSKYKDKFKEKYQVGLGFMSFFTKAVCEAIKDFPAVNAMINGEEIIYHDYVDISIAVSAPKGLVVPIIRNAQLLSFQEIEKAVIDLATKARDSKLSIEEMTGGTFSITNGGVFGSMLSTPILNPPQSAILGMHNIVERPVVIAGKIEIRPIMYLALSYDHRIIDGRESVSFLVKVKQYLEDPGRLLLGI